MDNKTISITFNLTASSDCELWKLWIDDAKQIVNRLGYTTTHIGYSSSKNAVGKIIESGKAETKIINAINENDMIKYISVFSLPNDYNSASFDYNVLVVRNLEYLTVISNKNDYTLDKQAEVINILRKYSGSALGEIYEMDKAEFPLSYAAKANPAEFYSSLRVIGKIE